jgi:NADPH:quinone reductase-like Zn-dependent oxidoreductase
MSEDGICVKTGGSAKLSGMLQDMLVAPILAMSGRKKTCSFFAKMNRNDFLFLNDLFEAGKMTPVIDRSFPLSETAAALRYLEEGHARGKVVITVAEEGGA